MFFFAFLEFQYVGWSICLWIMITSPIIPTFQSMSLATNTKIAKKCFAKTRRKWIHYVWIELHENGSLMFEWGRASDIIFPSWHHPKGSWVLDVKGPPRLPQEGVSGEGEVIKPFL